MLRVAGCGLLVFETRNPQPATNNQQKNSMRNSITWLAVAILFLACSSSPIERYGKHYQQHKDYESLSQVVELMELNVDTAYVKSILGEPIDMGFDYRYLIDSVGPNGCTIGAVFHIDQAGKIDQKWIDEICE